jgi:precorrin-2 methylase
MIANNNGAKRGSLVVVGTGIRTVGHLTMEAVAWIQQADKFSTSSVIRSRNRCYTSSIREVRSR